MIWFFAGVIGYILGHLPIHKVITYFIKKPCSALLLSNIAIKNYKNSVGIFSWLFIMPFILWYVFYNISYNQDVAHFSVLAFAMGNALVVLKKWEKYKSAVQVYPFVSLLFILSFKIALISVIIALILFLIIRKPLKTRAIFVFVSLLLLMLFPEELTDIFYILPVGILLLIADHDMILTNKEKRFKW